MQQLQQAACDLESACDNDAEAIDLAMIQVRQELETVISGLEQLEQA